AREGLSLVIADVAHGGVEAQGLWSGQGEIGPALGTEVPVERRGPSVSLHRGPAVREPELGTAIAAVFDEAEIVAGGDGAPAQVVGLEEDAMARTLVVEREAGSVVTDLHETAGMGRPFQGRDLGRGRRRGGPEARPIRGPQRVRPQRVLDVGEDELLVLLLVLQSQLDAIEDVSL